MYLCLKIAKNSYLLKQKVPLKEGLINVIMVHQAHLSLVDGHPLYYVPMLNYVYT